MRAHKPDSNEKDQHLIFDTLQFSKRAEQAGFTKEQADFQAEEIIKLIDTQLATKEDIENLSLMTKNDLKILKKDLIITFGIMLFALGGILITATGILISVLTR